MTMDPYSTDFCDLLVELVNEGRVPMSRIDDAVRRILRLKIRIGLMDRSTWDIPYGNTEKGKTKKGKKAPKTLSAMYPDFGSDKFAQEATSMAEECMVLLKNEQQVLPLRKGAKLFVCGPNANSFRTMNGGWTYTWQGNQTDEIATKIGKYRTFLGALEAKFGKENVAFSEMVRYDARNFNLDHKVQDGQQGDDALKDKIAAADVIVAFVGENSYTETPGNIDDLTLSPNQQDMVRSLASYGKPIVLVLNEGRPRIVSGIEPLAKAVVHTFLPGNYGGDALANLLAGEANFSGRMPYTYPKHHGSFITYDCKPCEYVETMAGAYNYDANTTVQWTFGSGISYSEVKYANLRVETPKAAGKVKPGKGFSPRSAAGTKYDGDLRFSVDVTNQSDRKVKEPVLLFVSDLVASLTPDVKRLRAFTKVELEAHETKTVTLTVQPSDLAFVNEDMEWVLEPGQFRAAVGNQRVEFSIE